MDELWIKGGTLLTLNQSRAILYDTNIYIVDGRIAFIGKGDQFPLPNGNENVIDAHGKIVLPGFINAHAHADCILARGGISQDQTLFDWRDSLTDPIRQIYSEEDLRVAIELYCHEAIRAGITTIVDLVGFKEGWRHQIVLETYERMGLRVIYGPMFTDKVSTFKSNSYSLSNKAGSNLSTVETTDEALKRIQHFLDHDHLKAGGKIKIWVAPRLARSTTPEGLKRSVELAKSYNTFTTTHCAETREESTGSAITTVEYLAQSGYLGERSILAHCVWVNPDDIEKLSQTQTRVVHCPSTNLYLASGVAPISKMLDAGVHVALGTDNANANNVISIAMEMREAALIQKGVDHDPRALTAEETLEMATIEGARVVGEESNLGSIEVGKQADLILIDQDHANMVPLVHIPAALVYQMTGNEVDTTIIAGKVLMKDRTLTGSTPAQEAKLFERAGQLAEELVRKAQLDMGRSQAWISRISR